ncbi:PspC domain-containing protein [Microbacterium sp. No. 7]|uniref:PspC domain-containing protein n=1 Tax=Microbacterium sp. No. 7 TaxID=1714373 RepID=UPI00300B3722
MPSPQTNAPPVDPPSPDLGRGERFFEWTSSLGVMRMDGWFGGVGAGTAARWGIDPLIVRGILVVVAVIGFPVTLVYGVAWALLPDAAGRIPAQDAWHRRFHTGQVGALLFIAASFIPAPLPLVLGIPSLAVLGGAYVGDLGGVVLLLAAVAIAVAVVAVLVAGPRQSRAGVPAPAEPAASDPPPHRDAPTEPETPLDSAGEDDLARWREQHAAWKEQDQAWRREQQDAARAARDQLRRERQESATAFSAEAAAKRRERHAIAPRAPLAFVTLAVGVAVIVGTIVALFTPGGDPIAAGLFVAALVLAGAMTVAGVLRRRSGFLAFVTAVALLGGAAATGVSVGQELHVDTGSVSNVDAPTGTFRQPWGTLWVSLEDTGREGELHLQKRFGATYVTVAAGVRVDLEIITTDATGGMYVADGYVGLRDIDGVVITPLADGRTRYTATLGDTESPRTTQKLLLEQDTGYIQLEPDTALDSEGNPS